MEPEDVADAFAYVRALQANDINTACAVANDTGPELPRLLLDVTGRIFIPVTAVDDCDGKPCRGRRWGQEPSPAPSRPPGRPPRTASDLFQRRDRASFT